MNARSFILLPIALGSMGFSARPLPDAPGQLEMKLSFPFLHKKYQACKDSSLTARIVICNKTDTIVSFLKKALEESVAFEIATTTTKFTIEKKEPSDEETIAILFPGDSLVMYSLLVSSTCQLSELSRRVPKPKQGLKTVRAVYAPNENAEVNYPVNTSYEEKQSGQPMTAPDYNRQRNAVRRSDGGNTSEIGRSLFKGTLASNTFQF